ncbi:MAG: sugar phosphate isomerase/epimerase, partial [Armatimonadetes bacterium]|nr:sugar phosphate isomerase/epimerase [Armatimonadota bacterium]
MKLGLMSAALPDLGLEQLADWAAENGFSMLELACWPVAEGAARRYAGVAHVDVVGLTDARASEIRRCLEARGMAISSLGYY